MYISPPLMLVDMALNQANLYTQYNKRQSEATQDHGRLLVLMTPLELTIF